MTQDQQRWTEGRIRLLREEIERKWPLSDRDWESLTEAVGRLIELSKRHQEVRSALFDLLEEYETRERKERMKRKGSREGDHESGK